MGMSSHKQQSNLERRENRHSYRSDNRYRPHPREFIREERDRDFSRGRYDMRIPERGPRFETRRFEERRFDGRHDGRFEGRHEGRFDGRHERYDGRFDGRQERYDGRQERYDGRPDSRYRVDRRYGRYSEDRRFDDRRSTFENRRFDRRRQ